ncbi:acyltransferase family protein [Azospirillum soli]|uniref:acyltransferase family protein n=1 Tax=Azospirillum soli TaxID=1304799 RepID=UPI001AE414F5|nr:acyltransferase [Azospirillum soli]MBP2312553.1 peptidoglycan/LPS O-acetylase OafA/YrhL [Azospirillum soli]
MTSLRFFAAFAVVLYHYGHYVGSVEPLASLYGLGFDSGFIGVTFFYVLSGFILSHAYRNRNLTEPGAVRRFLLARVARIVPVYLLGLALSFPFVLFWVLKLPPDGAEFLLRGSSLLLAPFMLQSWVPLGACTWNCPGWSLSNEAFFYLLFPLLLPLVWRRSFAVVVVVGGALLVAGWAVAWTMWGEPARLMDELAEPVPVQALAQAIKYLPINHLPAFVAGMLAYAVVTRWRGPSPGPWLFAAGLAAVLAGVALRDHVSIVVFHNALFIVPFAVLIAGAAGLGTGRCLWLERPGLVILGRISFALYILHMPIRTIATHPLLLGPTPMAHAVALPLSLLAAALVWRFVEEPARAQIMSFAKSPSPLRGSEPAR